MVSLPNPMVSPTKSQAPGPSNAHLAMRWEASAEENTAVAKVDQSLELRYWWWLIDIG